MTAEAGVGRYTPYELVFAAEELAGREFPAIAAEARARAVGESERAEFARLERVGALLALLLPEGAEPGALDSCLDVIFHAYHFWSAGRPVYAFAPSVVRSLVETPPDLGRWAVVTPHPSLYLELPRNMFWAAVAEGAPPEPVEGVFLRWDDRESDLLVVLGMRPGRGGFSTAATSAALDRAADAEGATFRTDIPGAELAGLYSLQRAAAAVALVRRLLWYLAAYPEAVEAVPGSRREGAGGAASLEGGHTGLDHQRVSWVERSRG
jgi:hypothetical protein